MVGKLAQEIRQTRPFKSVEEELYLNVLRTAEVLQYPVVELLKQRGISATQYNVLRILRGAGDDGLPCSEISARMITRDSDITRLLDRLESRGLVERRRSVTDRRVITAAVTGAGLELLASIDEPIVDLLRSMLEHLGARDMRSLVDLLETARDIPAEALPHSH